MRRTLGLCIHESFLKQEEASAAIGLLGELLINPPALTEFARYFPKMEYQNLAILISEAVSCGVDVILRVPVCPDYQDGYDKLGSGVGAAAKRFLNVVTNIADVFHHRNINISLAIDVADTEGVDFFLMPRLRVNKDEFFHRVSMTRRAIKEEIETRQIAIPLEIRSMLDEFRQAGIDYGMRQGELSKVFLDQSNKANSQLVDELSKERVRIGDYEDLGLKNEEFREAAAFELAGYALYGELVGADELICSPDAKSAIKAYNILKKDPATISPTLYIGGERKTKTIGGWE